MNGIDLILVLILVFTIWSGISRGFIGGIARLISWVGTLFITFLLYPYIARFFERNVMDSVWTTPLSFLLCLLFFGAVVALVVESLFRRVPVFIHTHPINKLFGFAPGLVIGLLYASVVAALLLLLPIAAPITQHTRESTLAQHLTRDLGRFERVFSPVFGEASRTINRMLIEPGSTERVSLPFSVTDAPPRADLEKEMLLLINAEREKVGLHPLEADNELVPVARQHSDDMFRRSYFSHVSPNGDTPFDRITQAGVSFLAAGENLALAQTLFLAHEGLMESPGHRANILRPAFGRVGIGILDGGIYGLMVTQKFRN